MNARKEKQRHKNKTYGKFVKKGKKVRALRVKKKERVEDSRRTTAVSMGRRKDLKMDDKRGRERRHQKGELGEDGKENGND